MLKIKILFTSGMLIFFSGVVNAQKIELFETWFSVEGVGHCHVEVVDIVGHAPGWSSQMRKNSKQLPIVTQLPLAINAADKRIHSRAKKIILHRNNIIYFRVIFPNGEKTHTLMTKTISIQGNDTKGKELFMNPIESLVANEADSLKMYVLQGFLEEIGRRCV